MKPSTQDQAEGKVHEIKGKIKEKAGEITDDQDLADEGTIEKIGGKAQGVVGKIEKKLGI